MSSTPNAPPAARRVLVELPLRPEMREALVRRLDKALCMTIADSERKGAGLTAADVVEVAERWTAALRDGLEREVAP